MNSTKSIAQLIREWAEQLDVQANTSAQHQRVAMYFFNWLESKKINQRKPEKKHAIIWKQELHQKYRDHTVSNYLISTRYFFQYLEDTGIYKNIFKNIRTPIRNKYNSRRMSLTNDQLNQLLNLPDKTTEQGRRDFAIMLLMVSCGLRAVEIHRILVRDLIESNGVYSINIQGKGQHDKQRIIIPEVVRDSILNYLEQKESVHDNDPMFTSTSNRNKGQAFGCNHLNQVIKKYMSRIGLDNNYSSHSLRHTAAVKLIDAGVNLEEIRIFLRHNNVATTQIYLSSITGLIKTDVKASSVIIEGLYLD